MTNAISTSFQQLNITDTPQPPTVSETNASSREKSKPGVVRMKLSHPPGAETCLRFQFFGYDTSQLWLAEFAKQRVKNTDDWEEPGLALEAVEMLKKMSGFKYLTMELGYLDDEAPPSAQALARGKFVALLAVCSTGDRSSYYRRPTQAQIDKLTELLEREPRWWTDYRPLDYYM